MEELKLGELKKRLEKLDGTKIVTTSIDFIEYIENTYNSDRGSYYDIALSFTNKIDEALTVSGVISLIDRALEDGIMYGYKGGDFEIDEDILVKIGEYGIPGFYIEDVVEEDNNVVLKLI